MDVRPGEAPAGRASANRWTTPSYSSIMVMTHLDIEVANGEFIAVVVNYPMHPVSLGHVNRQISADWCGGADRDLQGGAVDGGGADFFEGELEADLLHHGEAEVGFVAGRVLDAAVGFVNADELSAFLELFFGHRFGGIYDL